MKHFARLLAVAAICALGSVTAATADVVNLTFANTLPLPEVPPYTAAVDAWNKAHPDIQVTMTNTPWSSFWQEKQVQTASGRLPDIWTWVPGFGAQWLYGDQLLPIDQYAKDDATIDLKDANQTMLKYLTTSTGLHGLPYDFNGQAVFYNKKLFDQAGVPYPAANWTTDDMKNAATTISQKLSTGGHKIWGFAGVQPDWVMDGWYRAFGASLIDDQGKVGANTDGGRAAIQYFLDLIKAGVTPIPDQANADAQAAALFMSGSAAMVVHVGHNVTVYDDAGVDFGLARLPTGPAGQAGVGLGGAYVVTKSTQHPKEAYEFLRYITSGEVLAKVVGSGVPGRQSAWTNLSPHMLEFAKDITGYPPFNAVKGSFQVMDLQASILSTIWNQSVDVKTGMQQFEDQGNAALAGP